MDKRWIYILVIAVIGIAALFVVAESSNVIGTANLNLGKFIISVPNSYNIEDSDGSEIILINKQTHEKIVIEDLGKKVDYDSEFDNELSILNDNEDVIIINNTTNKSDEKALYSIYYNNTNKDTVNQIVYLSQYKHTFLIEATHFHDAKVINENINFIIDSLKPDYKQKQD